MNRNMKKIILSAALVAGVFTSSCFGTAGSLSVYADNDDGVIVLPFISLDDFETDPDDDQNENDKQNEDDTEKNPENDSDDGTIELPFVPADEPDDTLSGDINEDGILSAADIISLKKMLLMASETDSKADLNKDNKVDVFDLIILVNMFLE